MRRRLGDGADFGGALHEGAGDLSGIEKTGAVCGFDDREQHAVGDAGDEVADVFGAGERREGRLVGGRGHFSRLIVALPSGARGAEVVDEGVAAGGDGRIDAGGASAAGLASGKNDLFVHCGFPFGQDLSFIYKCELFFEIMCKIDQRFWRIESASYKLFFKLPIDKHLRCGQLRVQRAAPRSIRLWLRHPLAAREWANWLWLKNYTHHVLDEAGRLFLPGPILRRVTAPVP